MIIARLKIPSTKMSGAYQMQHGCMVRPAVTSFRTSRTRSASSFRNIISRIGTTGRLLDSLACISIPRTRNAKRSRINFPNFSDIIRKISNAIVRAARKLSSIVIFESEYHRDNLEERDCLFFALSLVNLKIWMYNILCKKF